MTFKAGQWVVVDTTAPYWPDYNKHKKGPFKISHIDLWEGLEDNYRELGFANGACFLINIENGAEVLAFLSKHCIITKKPEAFSAKKVLNKSKNN